MKINEVVTEQVVSEIGYTPGLGKLALSDRELIKNSVIDGTIGQREVRLYVNGKSSIYFFSTEDTVEALLLIVDGNHLMAIKNFTSSKGLVYSLFNYVINMKQKSLVIEPGDSLSDFGIEWIIRQNEEQGGFKITDQSGNTLSSSAIRLEWEKSKQNWGKAGPTGIIIGESSQGKWLRENEVSLMPYIVYGVNK